MDLTWRYVIDCLSLAIAAIAEAILIRTSVEQFGIFAQGCSQVLQTSHLL